jgi:hypothetical protein
MKSKSILVIFTAVALTTIPILTNAKSAGKASAHHSTKASSNESKSHTNTSELPIAPVDKSKNDNTSSKEKKSIGESQSLMNNAFNQMIHNINQ